MRVAAEELAAFCARGFHRGTYLSTPPRTVFMMSSVSYVSKNLVFPRFWTSMRAMSHDSMQPLTDTIRLSRLVSQYSSNISISRREAERLIRAGEVTVAGKPITSPHYLLSLDEASSAVKISGKLVMLKKNAAVGQGTVKTRVWLAHKLPGEVVSDHDPQNRPSLLTRLKRGGVGTKEDHLKAIGRLDIPTEGLVVVTNDGKYKRDLELPTNMVHRVYRARVHGKLTENKLKAIRNGMTIDNVTYRGMKVQIEVTRKSSSTNSWLRLTCTEGKNRQVRKVLAHLSLNVTRLIRISYGDYKLDTIPPGMALEVPVKLLASQKKSGRLIDVRKGDNSLSSARGVKAKDNDSSAIQWVRPI